jgi:hypothetical protein
VTLETRSFVRPRPTFSAFALVARARDQVIKQRCERIAWVSTALRMDKRAPPPLRGRL